VTRAFWTVIMFAVGASCTFGSAIVNGGFETGDFTGWTQSGWFIDTTNPNSGVYDASTGCSGASCTTVGDPNSAYVYQDVATTIGTTYDLSFFYDSGQDPTFGSELLVLWGDPTAPSLSTVVDLVDVDTSGAYVEYIGTVVATSVTSELEFLGRQDLDFYYLDDVSLTAVASSVPEPGTLGIVLIAILVLGAFVRNTPSRAHQPSKPRTNPRLLFGPRSPCNAAIN
jgi:hypothetical protein